MTEDTDAELESLPREELVERARALQTVLRVAHAVMNASSVKELAQRFVEGVAAYTRFPSIAMWRFLPASQEFVLLAEHGFDTSITRKNLRAKGSLTGLAAERREMLSSEDLEHDSRIDPEVRIALAANAYTSGTCVPVMHDGEVLGSFNLIYPRGSALGTHERHLLGTLAKGLGFALAQQIAAEQERELEAQARRAQQLESLGVLAAGISHDFNNLLTGIVGSVDMVRVLAQRAGQTEWAELLNQALGAASRAGSLANRLQTFSRGSVPARRLIDDLGTLIREVAMFTVRGTSVGCDVQIAEPLGVVDVDIGQIAQVIQNLVLNACQASHGGKTVHVRARRALGPAGACVLIEVADTGSGIAPEHLPQIFDPFFSARPGGTGLGLTVSYSIIRRHGGQLRVSSELGRGTTFDIELPASECAIRAQKPAPVPIKTFSGRALLMDDDAAVRRTASVLLHSLGFEVDSVEHGAEALDHAARAAAAGKPFGVAVLDLTIVGGLGASDIAEDLRHASPDVGLVLSSGYGSAEPSQGWDALLQKPYTLQELSSAIDQALQARHPG